MCVVEQESGLKVNQPASFAVSLNGAKGVIDAKVHSPSGALEECCVTEIDQGNPRLQAGVGWLLKGFIMQHYNNSFLISVSYFFPRKCSVSEMNALFMSNNGKIIMNSTNGNVLHIKRGAPIL